MNKIPYFIVLCLLIFQGSAFANDAGLVTTTAEDSYFANSDITAQGRGNCVLSGAQTFSGSCDVQLLKLNGTNVFEITLSNGKGHFRVQQVTNGTSGQYFTTINDNEVITSMQEISPGESIITMDALVLQITLQQLVTRK